MRRTKSASRLQVDQWARGPISGFQFGLPWPWEVVPAAEHFDSGSGELPELCVSAPRHDYRNPWFAVFTQPFSGMLDSRAISARASELEQMTNARCIRQRRRLGAIAGTLLVAGSSTLRGEILVSYRDTLFQGQLELPDRAYLHHITLMLETWQF